MLTTTNTPTLLSDKEILLAKVLREHHPNQWTDPQVGVEWYDIVRSIAQELSRRAQTSGTSSLNLPDIFGKRA
jgi:hypothetical protein